MSCADCKHWRVAKIPIDRQGICIKFSSQYTQKEGEPNGAVYEHPRSKRRRGNASRVAGHVMVTWNTDPKPAYVTTLGVYFYTMAEFSCALYERTKRVRRLPILDNVRSRFERVVEETSSTRG